MPTPAEWLACIGEGCLDRALVQLYGSAGERPDALLPAQRRRYVRLLQEYRDRYGDTPVRLFSSPGRTELGGNHTDHNHGRALAAAVQLDCIAVAGSPGGRAGDRDAPTQARTDHPPDFRVFSLDFGREYRVDGADVLFAAGPRPTEQGSLTALLRGILAWFAEHQLPAAPFCAVLQSDVQPGSGLSSSACIEVLLATMAARDAAPLSPLDAARCGQFAENEYFGKPCGLLDQLAIASGGVVALDFADPQAPAVTPLQADFAAAGYRLCIIHTDSDHSAGTDAYAAIPSEMRRVAHWFGVDSLRGVDEGAFWEAFPRLRSELSGRALARAGHFFAENRRVGAMTAALSRLDIPAYLQQVDASGRSSHQFLQNVVDDNRNQDYGLALLLLQSRFGERGVVSRVHGGGFGGAVQAYVPAAAWEAVAHAAEVGIGRIVPLSVRPWGPIEILSDGSISAGGVT